jgi:SAM-dependent methyltransferase
VNFFKDRHWFQLEFPELFRLRAGDDSVGTAGVDEEIYRVLEVGCGVGNGLFPILQHLSTTRPHNSFHVYGCDFAPTAIELCRRHADYDTDRCTVFVHDLTVDPTDTDQAPIEPESVDVIVMVFVLSAIHPTKFAQCIANVYKVRLCTCDKFLMFMK